MYIFLNEIENRMEKLRKIIEEKQVALQNAPKGVINICKTDERIQYYYKESSEDKVRKYLKNREVHIVKELFQKDYDQKVLKLAQNELKQLKKIMGKYPLQMCEGVYEKLNECRKTLVEPIEISDEEFIKNWQNVEYDRMGFSKDDAEYYTDDGERVRSKSEIIIAHALRKHGIPYRYEYPLYLNGYGMVRPDFVVLNVRLRKEYYWEHLGMMDDADYSERNLYKLTNYEKNDILPGDKLIVTHETLKHPINLKIIEKIIQKFLI